MNKYSVITAIAIVVIVTPFVFSAIAFPIFGGTENFGAKEPVFFGLKGSIVDRFGLFNFPIGPRTNFFRRSDPNAHRIEGHRIAWLFK